MEKAIVVKGVSKKYKLYENSKERLLDLIRPDKYGESFYALTNVDFEANTGEVVGFIGTNGSGKSTLSNIIAGIVPETTGSVDVNGDVALIAVAAGLKNDLSGRENIELKLLMLGFNKQEIDDLESAIIEFAELEKFIDQPVKSYSSGMKSRLGFAISVSVDPEILIIDEALSVGDKAFAEKSLNKMREFKSEGKTMIFVSHSIGQMKKFCDKILWLEFGHVKEYGTVSEVIPKYEAFLELWKKLTKKEREQYRINAVNQNHVNNEKLIKEKKQKKKREGSKYEERLISRLGRLRAKDSYIYETPRDEMKRKASKSYRGSVYYIKKRAIYNDKTYYLLSNNPSAKHDIIGWMKSADLATYRHLNIDEDYKLLEVKGTGVGYDKPWGSKKNIIISDLAMYQNKQFHVDKTDRIGQNLWYCGILEDKRVWIHEKDLK